LLVKDFGIISEIDWSPGKGLNILSGETGAGKSILIDSINILLGDRASKDIIRSGCTKAIVSACFDNPSPEVSALLNECGITSEDGDLLLLQRDITADGKSMARVNGRQISVSMLREIGKLLINIHGQHENNALLNSESHLKYLDTYANNANILAEYQNIYKQVHTIEKAIEELNMDENEKAHKTELLQYQIKEIQNANLSYPKSDEDEEDILTKRRNILANKEKIMTSIESMWEILMSNEDNIHDMMSEAEKYMSQASRYDDNLNVFAERLNNIYADLDSLIEDIRDYKNDSDLEYNDLNAVEDRLDLIYKLKRKYGHNITEILDYEKKCREELEAIEFSDEKLLKLKNELKKVKADLKLNADKLTKSRTEASKKLEENIINELTFLDMPKIRFVVSVESCEPNSNGFDNIEFLMSTNVGEPLRPMSKIASGGELSRIMLSIKNVLTKADTVDTLIFDEIDTGVSGKAAQKIAIKLKQMSQNKQVIVVTHLAQIAAYGTEHFLISKSTENNRTYTKVDLLNYEGRKNEIARIMGGINITDAMLKTADEMLQTAMLQTASI
jgi:DNA repair protein RecN (Recombination protein N)